MLCWYSLLIVHLLVMQSISIMKVDVNNTLNFSSNIVLVQPVSNNGFIIQLEDQQLKLYDQNLVFVQQLVGHGVLFQEISVLESNRNYFCLYSTQNFAFCIYELNSTNIANYTFLCGNFPGLIAVKTIAPREIIVVSNYSVCHILWTTVLIETFIGNLSYTAYAIAFRETSIYSKFQFLALQYRTSSLAGTFYRGNGNNTTLFNSTDFVSLISPISNTYAIFLSYKSNFSFVIQNLLFETYVLDVTANITYYVYSLNQSERINQILFDTPLIFYSIYQTKIGTISYSSYYYQDQYINTDIPSNFKIAKNDVKDYYGYVKGTPTLYKVFQCFTTISSCSYPPITCLDPSCLSCTYSSSLCNTCATGYNLSNFQCLSTAVPTTTNTTTNATTNTTTNTTTNNSTLNSSSLDENNTLPVIVISVKETITYINSFPNIRVLFRIILPFYLILDDCWYYDYHSQNWTWFSKTFASQIMKTNDQKFVPPYINIDQVQQTASIGHVLESNFTAYTPQKLLNRSSVDIQFLRNTQQLYLWSYMLIFCTFLVLRVFTQILRLISSCANFTLLNFIYIIFYNRTRKQMLIISAIQANVIFIAFHASTQFKTFFQFNFFDKINLIVSTLFLFLTIIFVVAFYPLIHRYKRSVFRFFSLSKISSYYYFINENFLMNLKLLVYGMLHGYFLDSSSVLFYCLIVLKIMLIIFTIYSVKTFINCTIFLSTLSYYIFATLFDVSLLLQLNHHEILPNSWVYTDMGLISAMILSIILKFSATAYFQLKSILLKHCKSNQVTDSKEEQKDKIENSSQAKQQSKQNEWKQEQSESKVCSSEIDSSQLTSQSSDPCSLIHHQRNPFKRKKLQLQSLSSVSSVEKIKTVFPKFARLNKIKIHIAEKPEDFEKKYNLTFKLKNEKQK